MTASLLFLPIAWILTAAGRQVAAWLRLPEDASTLERNLIGFAVGVGLLAYGMLLLGLVGAFMLLPALGLLLLLLLLGAREHAGLARSIRTRAPALRDLRGWAVGAAVTFLLFALVALSGVYAPPTLIEWDSLAYHLADPKIYIQAHRIVYLPWEDHSNFAFNLEMCYALGLLLHSVPLAKMFHFACAVGLTATTYALGARLFSPRIGLWAALLLAVTPIVFWEAGTAYVDLALAFYATLTLLALVRGAQERCGRWLGVGAVLMGLTLSTKGTALGVLGLLTLGLLFWRLKRREGWGRSVWKTARWAMAALVVGSPWYLKSWAYTRNPVYPFFYGLFDGRYWNRANADSYDAWNASFGAGRGLGQLLLVPWNATMALLPGHLPLSTLPKFPAHWAFNDYQTPLMTLTPVLLAALFFPAFTTPGRTPKAVKMLAVYALVSILIWFWTAQHVRYLLPVLPVLCLLAAWTLGEALRTTRFAGRALAGLAGCSVLFSLLLGAQLLARQVPVDLGMAPREDYLAAGDRAYPAMQFINRHLPPGSRVVFYGNPLGFYCDKPYLWGEPQHGTYIPYDTFHTAGDLRRGLQKMGVTHILVNTVNFGMTPDAGGYVGQVYQVTAGAGPPVFGDSDDPRQHVFVYALSPGR